LVKKTIIRLNSLNSDYFDDRLRDIRQKITLNERVC